jgi:hypothetical protein
MSMPEGCPQTEMLHSNLQIDAVTALSVAPSDSPKEITPGQDCAEDDEVKE